MKLDNQSAAHLFHSSELVEGIALQALDQESYQGILVHIIPPNLQH